MDGNRLRATAFTSAMFAATHSAVAQTRRFSPIFHR